MLQKLSTSEPKQDSAGRGLVTNLDSITGTTDYPVTLDPEKQIQE